MDFGHSPLTPLPKIQNKKTKLKFFFRAIPIAIGIKVKHAHHITRHIWLRLLYKSLHPYLPPLRYGKHQICRNVVQNASASLRHFGQRRAVPAVVRLSLRYAPAHRTTAAIRNSASRKIPLHSIFLPAKLRIAARR